MNRSRSPPERTSKGMAPPSAFSLDAAASLASPEKFGFTPANFPLTAPASYRPAGSRMSSARASR
eukprot:2292068-Heterocapsa_arctica.AAC.1